ncbi:hypothetical protein XA68_12837 [Ophiocordyceps unilateralis]|uniref:E3 ubiquitin ligase complex SCF subunit n=1 Tax=Ophiocordyceps unilateralis TaxID=268505 RepID=A0A2A9PDS8_OPHUN|nr:hypothetical protein XA68_12837 [Ophiocordyceps unilateralis]
MNNILSVPKRKQKKKKKVTDDTLALHQALDGNVAAKARITFVYSFPHTRARAPTVSPDVNHLYLINRVVPESSLRLSPSPSSEPVTKQLSLSDSQKTSSPLHHKRSSAASEMSDMASSSQHEKVWLNSNDNALIEVDRDVIERSVLIKNLLGDCEAKSSKENPVPIPNVNEAVLRKVLEWCEFHRNDPPPVQDEESDARKKSTDIDDWDQKFMQVDQEMLFEIILASNYLDIKPLLDVGCKTVANMIKGKSPEEIRKTFNITNDFTPEEEEQIRRENEWAEDR